MPQRVVVKPSGDIVTVRKVRKNARPYHMGTVMLKNVKVLPDGLEGEWLSEFEEIREPGQEVLKYLTELVYEPGEGFGEIDVQEDSEGEDLVSFESATGKTYRAAYVFGDSFYVG